MGRSFFFYYSLSTRRALSLFHQAENPGACKEKALLFSRARTASRIDNVDVLIRGDDLFTAADRSSAAAAPGERERERDEPFICARVVYIRDMIFPPHACTY